MRVVHDTIVPSDPLGVFEKRQVPRHEISSLFEGSRSEKKVRALFPTPPAPPTMSSPLSDRAYRTPQ